MFPLLLAFANFGILTGLGLSFRHRPAVHKRLMLLALGVLVLTPLIHLSGHLIGRWPGLYAPLNLGIFIAANALPFSVAVHDKVSDGRVHPISLWVPVLLIVETFGLIRRRHALRWVAPTGHVARQLAGEVHDTDILGRGRARYTATHRGPFLTSKSALLRNRSAPTSKKLERQANPAGNLGEPGPN